MDKERRVLLDNRRADCLNSSGQLRVSVTGPLKTPSFPLRRLSHYPDRPASVPVLGEGWGWECRAEMAFVPFIKSAASLSSHDQQGRSPMTFSRELLSSNNNMWRDKSFTNSGEGVLGEPDRSYFAMKFYSWTLLVNLFSLKLLHLLLLLLCPFHTRHLRLINERIWTCSCATVVTG